VLLVTQRAGGEQQSKAIARIHFMSFSRSSQEQKFPLAADERAATRPPICTSSLKLAILDVSFIGNRYAAG
jgi:hypothetical protein